MRKYRKEWIANSLQTLAYQLLAFSIIFLVTRSTNIALPISIIVSYLPQILKRNKKRKEFELRRKSWPLVIDQLATATASGVSLHSALLEMDTRGPECLKLEFGSFKETFQKEGSLERGLSTLVESAKLRVSASHTRRAVQLKSTLLIARDFGGHEVGAILRNLSAHLRQKERAFDEISIRQDWIKNGAILAALTPWLLLLILSLHSQTVTAYNSASGRFVLLTGLVITVIAYKWINRISSSVAQEDNF